MNIVRESLSFERGKDPMDALNIGNPKVRGVMQSLKDLQSHADNGFLENELNFTKVIGDIANLKHIIELVVINFMDSKYELEKIDYSSIENYEDQFVTYWIEPYYLIFKHSSGGSTIYIKIKGPEGKEETPGSTSLKSLERKLIGLIKKYKLSITKKEA
jgi:hypothetical protein